MSKRCELQKEYYQANGNYKVDGNYCDKYVSWLEEKILNKITNDKNSHEILKKCCNDLLDRVAVSIPPYNQINELKILLNR